MYPLSQKVKHEILAVYHEKQNVKETAKQVNVHVTSVYRVLREQGVTLRSCAYQKDKYKSSNCFLDFNNEADSYFYGLLLADGNLTENINGSNKIQISLCKQDEYILRELKSFLNSSNKITTRKIESHTGVKEYSHFCIGSVTLYERLVRMGMTPRKSCNESLPNFDWMENRHFWRGVVDGDGSLYYMHGRPKLKLIGSEDVVKGFNEFCWKNCFTKRATIVKDNRCAGLYYICFNGEEALQISNVLYSDSTVKLIRKYNKYVEFVNFFKVSRCGLKKGIALTKYGTYKVSLKVDGKTKHLGSFKTYKEALTVRLQAEIDYHDKCSEEQLWQYQLSTLLDLMLV